MSRPTTHLISAVLLLILASARAYADSEQTANSSLNSLDQADSERNFVTRSHIGGKIGPNLSSFAGPGTNEEFIDYAYKMGMSVGVAAGLRITETFAAQLELAFVTKGPKSIKDGMNSGNYHLRYIEIPFFANLILPLNKKTEIYATLGPSLAILVGAEIDLVDGRSIDLTDRLERFDIGLLLGAGAAVGVRERDAITLELRYNRGLTNFSQTVAGDEDKIMNQAFYFMVGYRANLDDLLHGFRRKAPPPASKVPPASHAPEPDAAPTDTPAPDTEPAPTEPMSPLDKPHAQQPAHP